MLGSERGTKVNKESPSHVLGLTLMPPKEPSNVPSTWHIPFPSQREPRNSGKHVYHIPTMSQHRAEESKEAVPRTVSMFVGTQASTAAGREPGALAFVLTFEVIELLAPVINFLIRKMELKT